MAGGPSDRLRPSYLLALMMSLCYPASFFSPVPYTARPRLEEPFCEGSPAVNSFSLPSTKA